MGFGLSCLLAKRKTKLCCSGSAKLLTLCCAISFFCSLHYILQEDLGFNVTRSSVWTLPEHHDFEDYESNNTKTFHTVCITNINVTFPDPKHCLFWYAQNTSYQLLCRRKCRHPQKLITVYVQDNITNEEAQNLTADAASVGYNISFEHIAKLPSDYDMIENQTAYFLGISKLPYEPENFFHFTKQIYFALYWLIKSTNQLYNGANNLVFYPGPYATCVESIVYHDIKRYKYFRDILHVENELELSAFIDQPEPHQVCYKNAVFSNQTFVENSAGAIEHFKNSLGIVDDVCKGKQITILNRSKYRRILQVHELIEVGEELGYRTEVVALENMSWREQAQLIHCTDILVGVTGAGLQWAFFMKDHSGVIEIAWPDKEWPFFFTGTGRYQSEQRDVVRPLKFAQLQGKCQINPSSLSSYAEDLFYKEITIPHKESLEILQNKENYNFTRNPVTSLGKLCDVTVNKEAFRKAVKAAARGRA